MNMKVKLTLNLNLLILKAILRTLINSDGYFKTFLIIKSSSGLSVRSEGAWPRDGWLRTRKFECRLGGKITNTADDVELDRDNTFD